MWHHTRAFVFAMEIGVLKSKYRPDIDGLRAIAVLSVVLFHAGIPGFSGGYVGVDVFFVISGYLITLLLQEELKHGEFSLARFYERRVRRIFPALAGLLFGCTIAAAVWFIPEDFSEFSQSLWAAALSVSNFWFWQEAGYFDGPSHFKPLLHTWSLAVEEQFYLFFPLILMAAHRWASRFVGIIILAMVVSSFAAAYWTTRTSPESAFYLLPYRAWELMAGSLLAVGVVPAIQNSILRSFSAIVGLTLVIVPIFIYSSETPFPGAAALAPTIGACLLINAGSNGALVSRLLQARPLVFVGLISYSVYLWHWPLIVFTRYYVPEDLALSTELLLVAASLAAGWASWRWIEQPFRSRRILRNRKSVVTGGAVAMGLLAAAGIAGAVTNGLPQRWSPEALRYASMVDKEIYFGIYDRGGCFLDYDQGATDYDYSMCGDFNSDRPKVLIYGDSFAAHLYPGLTSLAANKAEIRQYTATSCRPLLANNKRCNRIYKHFISDIIPESEAELVIVSAYWTPYYERLGSDLFEDRLADALKKITGAGKQVALIGQSPTYHRAVPYVLATQAPADREVILPAKDSKSVNELLKMIAAELKVPFLNPYEFACSKGSCRAAAGGEPYHWDFGHMTLAGSEFYGRSVLELTLKALKANDSVSHSVSVE